MSAAYSCERTKEREKENKRDRSRERRGMEEREKERDGREARDERERGRRGERGSKECMGTRRKRADRDLPVPHSTNAKASSRALLSSVSSGGRGRGEGATGHGLTP